MVESHAADLVVVGTGIAGLACALAFPGRVLLVTKTDLAESGSSYLARGGIAAAIGPGTARPSTPPTRSPAPAGIAEPAVVQALAAAAPAAVEALVDLGVPFGRAADGSLALGREAAHSFPRIVHAGGDATGRHVGDALLRAVRARPNVTLLEGCFAFDLLTAKGSVCGLLAYDDARGWLVLRSTRVVLASGGIGALYAETTNPPEATGDGLAMAARAGAALADLEFVQFHPTALDAGGAARGGSALPLLSEALRGAGALLVDDRGSRFITAEDPRGELAPRDVVSRAVFRRRAAGHRVMLDLRPALLASGGAWRLSGRRGGLPPRRPRPRGNPRPGPARGPLPHGRRAGRRARPHLDPGPVGLRRGRRHRRPRRQPPRQQQPARGRGERRPGRRRRRRPPPAALRRQPPPSRSRPCPTRSPCPPLREGLRRLASRRLGVERDRAGLERPWPRSARPRAPEPPTSRALGGGSGWLAAVRAYGELRNLRLVARLVATTALAREESRGAHFRRDHPEPRPSGAAARS
jgi:L-aspartate oxidase